VGVEYLEHETPHMFSRVLHILIQSHMSISVITSRKRSGQKIKFYIVGEGDGGTCSTHESEDIHEKLWYEDQKGDH
jgi:hypothetical protein